MESKTFVNKVWLHLKRRVKDSNRKNIRNPDLEMKFVTILLPVKLTTPCDNISFSLRASHSKYDTTSVSYFPTGNLYVRRCAARPGRSLAKKNMNCGQQSEFWSVPCKLITAGLQNPTQHFTLSDLDWPPLQSADR